MSNREGRFLLFGGACYYPSGGWADFIGEYTTLDEARDAWLAHARGWRKIGADYGSGAWAHVVDWPARAVVAWASYEPARDWEWRKNAERNDWHAAESPNAGPGAAWGSEQE